MEDIIKLNPSDVIAIIALLISVPSALYARWSWSEAKKANYLSALPQRKEVFVSFLQLKTYMSLFSTLASSIELSKFYLPCKVASLHFPKEISDSLEEYHRVCMEIAFRSERNKVKIDSDKEALTELIERESKLAESIEQEIFKIIGNKGT